MFKSLLWLGAGVLIGAVFVQPAHAMAATYNGVSWDGAELQCDKGVDPSCGDWGSAFVSGDSITVSGTAACGAEDIDGDYSVAAVVDFSDSLNAWWMTTSPAPGTIAGGYCFDFPVSIEVNTPTTTPTTTPTVIIFPSYATTSQNAIVVDNATADIFYAFILFFVSAFFMIYIFKKRS